VLQTFKTFLRAPTMVALLSAGILAGCASTPPWGSSTGADGAGGSGAGGAAGAGVMGSAATAKEIAAAKTVVDRTEPSIYFDFDSFTIKLDYQSTITNFANYLKADARARLVVEGNADERGTTEYNLALGQKRAEAVRRAMRVMGVAEGRVEAISNGEEKPRGVGSTEEAWAQNRRADLIIK
jgi:peptidoglycan-associated lipoprotein